MPEIIELDKIIYLIKANVSSSDRSSDSEQNDNNGIHYNNSIIQIIKTIHIFEVIQSIKNVVRCA